MEESQFEYLVEALTPVILKEDTNVRECIKAHEMVCLALRYLASGETPKSWIPVLNRKKDYIGLLLMFLELSLLRYSTNSGNS